MAIAAPTTPYANPHDSRELWFEAFPPTLIAMQPIPTFAFLPQDVVPAVFEASPEPAIATHPTPMAAADPHDPAPD
jgi:hypothetical protein